MTTLYYFIIILGFTLVFIRNDLVDALIFFELFLFFDLFDFLDFEDLEDDVDFDLDLDDEFSLSPIRKSISSSGNNPNCLMECRFESHVMCIYK